MSEDLRAAAERLARFLEASGKRAAIVGGLAIIARVRVRTTHDVDAVVIVQEEDILPLVALARSHGYEVGPTPEKDLREMGLLRMWGPPGRPDGTIADLIVADNAVLRNTVTRATPVDFHGLSLPVASCEDLVVLKLDANRGVDVDDVLAIKDAAGATLDLEHVRREADLLGPEVRRRVELYFGAP